MNKHIFILFVLLISYSTYGQTIKKKTGTAKWKKGSIVLADSILVIEVSFNKKVQKQCETSYSHRENLRLEEISMTCFDNAGFEVATKDNSGEVSKYHDENGNDTLIVEKSNGSRTETHIHITYDS